MVCLVSKPPMKPVDSFVYQQNRVGLALHEGAMRTQTSNGLHTSILRINCAALPPHHASSNTLKPPWHLPSHVLLIFQRYRLKRYQAVRKHEPGLEFIFLKDFDI